MAKTRREFSPEFKREAVALLESSGGPLMQVATEGGRAGRLVDAVASGPGVGDRAIET